MRTNKAIRVRYSPIFEGQLKKLREMIKEKDSKFHNQLLKAIQREEDNLLIDMHRGGSGPKKPDSTGIYRLVWRQQFMED